jgi:hypothetical protein
MEFITWKKIPRLVNEEYTFTEKIDGTNCCIAIDTDGSFHCQSRTRIITRDDDNFGFAKWVYTNWDELSKLGPGYHFGEWWGKGIQRGYNLEEKRFSVFYYHNELPTTLVHRVPNLGVNSAEEAVEVLKTQGSLASPGYMKPEGVVMYCRLTNSRYKIIIDK